jgi:hypothetical protein
MTGNDFRRRAFIAAAGLLGGGLLRTRTAAAQTLEPKLAPAAGGPGRLEFESTYRPPFANAQPRPVLSKLNEVYSVLDFGAKGDGIADDTAAIARAYGALPPTGGMLIFPSGRKFNVTEVNLPLDRHVWTWGYGAVIQSTASSPALKRMPTDQGQAGVAVAYVCSIYGLSFSGAQIAGQKGAQIGATYNTVIQDCAFEGLDTGLELQFCLKAYVRSCMAGQNVTDSFVARHGTWKGATTSNAQSNQTVFESCRVYSAPGAQSAFKLYASNGIGLYDCITEGDNPVNNIEFDYNGSTTVKLFTITNLHSENIPRNAIIKCAGAGIVTINGVYFQLPTTLIDSTGSHSDTTFNIKNIPYWPRARLDAKTLFSLKNLSDWPRAKLNQGPRRHGPSWVVSGAIPGTDLRDPAYWVGGIIPERLHQITNTDSGELLLDAGDRNKLSFGGASFACLEDNASDFGSPDGRIGRIRNLYVGSGIVPANGSTKLTAYIGTMTEPSFGSIPAGSTAEAAVAVPGARLTDAVIVTPAGGLNAGLMVSAYVSSADVVNIRVANVTPRPIQPTPNVQFAVAIVRF